jgi:hypothetical protein
VKSPARAAVAALITITASVAALLPFSGPALASATPPSPNPALSGTWANTNAATRNVADIVVTRKAGGCRLTASARALRGGASGARSRAPSSGQTPAR